jgi:hypothetical protein
MVVHKGVYHTDFLIFTALLDCLTCVTFDYGKTTACTVVRYVQMYDMNIRTVCTNVRYEHTYGMYKCTIRTYVLYVQMYDYNFARGFVRVADVEGGTRAEGV